jgi:hypothetical protein
VQSNPPAARSGPWKYAAIMSPARSRCEGSGSPVALIRTRISSNCYSKPHWPDGTEYWLRPRFVLSETV